MSKAVVFSGGLVTDYDVISSYINDVCYVICADSGILHCNNLGIKADLWVGDFDSSDFEKYSKLPAANKAEVVRLNPVKNDTDTEHALDCALERGYKDIVLIGGIGTRVDHTMANVFLMEKIFEQKAVLTIVDENNILHFVKDSSITLNKTKMKYISVLPLDDVTVTNEGFVYPLNNEILYRNSTRGVSNRLRENTGKIYVTGGSAVIIESMD